MIVVLQGKIRQNKATQDQVTVGKNNREENVGQWKKKSGEERKKNCAGPGIGQHMARQRFGKATNKGSTLRNAEQNRGRQYDLMKSKGSQGKTRK